MKQSLQGLIEKYGSAFIEVDDRLNFFDSKNRKVFSYDRKNRDVSEHDVDELKNELKPAMNGNVMMVKNAPQSFVMCMVCQNRHEHYKDITDKEIMDDLYKHDLIRYSRDLTEKECELIDLIPNEEMGDIVFPIFGIHEKFDAWIEILYARGF